MDCPVLCLCKMVQGFGRCHLESFELIFQEHDSLFAGGFHFVPVRTAEAVVAGLYFLYRMNVYITCII